MVAEKGRVYLCNESFRKLGFIGGEKKGHFERDLIFAGSRCLLILLFTQFFSQVTLSIAVHGRFLFVYTQLVYDVIPVCVEVGNHQ